MTPDARIERPVTGLSALDDLGALVARRHDLDPAGQVRVGRRRAGTRASIRVIVRTESEKAMTVEPAPDRQAPIAPASRAASTSRGSCGIDLRPVRLVEPVDGQDAAAGRTGPVAIPATPIATRVRFATASASGTLAGRTRPHLARSRGADRG